MKKLKVLMAATLVAAVTVTGCATHTMYNTAYKNKLELGKDKFLIMPVDFHGFPTKMATMLEITIFAGFAFHPFTALILAPLILCTIFIRYYLKRHTLGELISGSLVGTLVVLGMAALGFFKT